MDLFFGAMQLGGGLVCGVVLVVIVLAMIDIWIASSK